MKSREIEPDMEADGCFTYLVTAFLQQSTIYIHVLIPQALSNHFLLFSDTFYLRSGCQTTLNSWYASYELIFTNLCNIQTSLCTCRMTSEYDMISHSPTVSSCRTFVHYCWLFRHKRVQIHYYNAQRFSFQSFQKRSPHTLGSNKKAMPNLRYRRVKGPPFAPMTSIL